MQLFIVLNCLSFAPLYQTQVLKTKRNVSLDSFIFTWFKFSLLCTWTSLVPVLVSRTVPSPVLLGYGKKKACKLQSAAAHTVQSPAPPLSFCINILLSLVLCHHLVWRASCLSWRSPVQPPQVTFPQLAEPCRAQQSWISGWLSVYSQHPEGQIAQTLHRHGAYATSVSVL